MDASGHPKRTYIYVRQSTLAQTVRNTESLARQYDLAGRARELGWAEHQIVMVDDDLGRSGASAHGRKGFSDLVADVGLGKAGIVLSLECSRLARNNSDWYQLLDLCALTDTLIADADGLYHPGLFNDRLVLGLKGTMSEALCRYRHKYSVTESIEDMIAAAYDEAGRRDPQRIRQRVFLADGNKQQITAIQAQAEERGLKVPVLIDYIHVSGYIGKAAAALHPGDPAAAGQWADGQLLRVLHGRAKAVAATLASVAAKTRAHPRTRHLDLTGMDRAVTCLTNNQQHMKYDKALANGWPIATGMIEGACRFVIEDRFGITGARWSPDGADTILKLRAVVVNGDLDDYMRYYKERYRSEHHLARYDPGTIERLNLAA